MRPGFVNRSSSPVIDRIGAWWSRRSRLHRCLCACLTLSVLACVALALVLIITLHPDSSHISILRVRKGRDADAEATACQVTEDNCTTCLTPACVIIAAEYLKNINPCVNPCDDFYSFACGSYEANSVIADDKTSQTPFVAVEDEFTRRLRSLLESPPDDREVKVFSKVRHYYRACMNKSEVERLKEKPLKDLVQQLGGWPAVEGAKWTDKAFDWTKTIYKLRDIGITHNILVDFSVSVDVRNSSKYTIEVDETSLGMSSRTSLMKGINSSLVQKYLKFMVETAVLLGAKYESANKELREAVLFEIQLARITLPSEERRNFNRLYNKKTLKELQHIAPVVNWVEFANKMLLDNVTNDEVVIVIAASYLEKLTQLLKATSKRTVANYVMWRVALSMMGMLDDRFRNAMFTYNRMITGQSVDDPRWKICLTTSRALFGNAMGAMYVRRYLDKNARETVMKLVHDVRQAFLNSLRKVDWMDDVTRCRAINKAHMMEEVIAYPPEVLNDTELDNHYQKILVKENKYFESTMMLKKVWTDYQYSRLRKTHKRNDWREFEIDTEINAYFSPEKNSIIIPAGILQNVFFDGDRPRYVNYGSIGNVIGHEITHGFYDLGRQFDDMGNQKVWWESDTDIKFQNKTECVIEQYNRYRIPEVNMTVSGINTQGENIADNGGAKAAYQAYERWVCENAEEKALPGLDLSTRQTFWMSFANVWCSKTRPEAVLFRLLAATHSPQKFRVNGVVSNSPAFAKDFNCPLGSPMNPVNKCAIW